MIDAAAELAAWARARAEHGTPVLIGIAGAVASGKSHFAAEAADAMHSAGLPAEVVTTDGFLFPNRVLTSRGLLAHKGYPDSYDVTALRAFVAAARRGDSEIAIPVYSHAVYDVVEGEDRVVHPAGALVIEGVNVLGALAGRLDVGVYLQVDERDLERWYVTRFLQLWEAGRDDPESFYKMFASMDLEEVISVATETWRSVNLPNLREHIAPTRAHADVVVVKGPDHQALEVREQRPPAQQER